MGRQFEAFDFSKSDFYSLRPSPRFRILAVGGSERHFDEGTQKLTSLRMVSFAHLSEHGFGDFVPDTVVSQLVSLEFDCFELSEVLSRLGFRGKYRVFAENLPRPDLVRAEIKGNYPEIDFDIRIVGGDRRRRRRT